MKGEATGAALTEGLPQMPFFLGGKAKVRILLQAGDQAGGREDHPSSDCQSRVPSLGCRTCHWQRFGCTSVLHVTEEEINGIDHAFGNVGKGRWEEEGHLDGTMHNLQKRCLTLVSVLLCLKQCRRADIHSRDSACKQGLMAPTPVNAYPSTPHTESSTV